MSASVRLSVTSTSVMQLFANSVHEMEFNSVLFSLCAVNKP